MNEQQADELWVRYLEGDMMARERAALNQSLVYQSHRRDGLIDDSELDGILQVLGHIEVTADDFVEQVMGRLHDEAVSEFPLASNEDESKEHGDWPSAVSRVAPPPVPPPVVSEDAHSVSKAERISRSEFPARVGKRSRSAQVLTAAALLVVAVVGAIIIVTNHDANRMAEQPDKKRPQAADPGRADSGRDKVAIDQPEKETIEQPVPNNDVAVPRVVQDPAPRPEPKPDERDVVGIERSPDKPVHVAPAGSNPSGTASDNSKVLARLTKSLRAAWQGKTPQEFTSEPFSLESGIVEITMNDGVVLTVLGPADFQLDSPGCVLLSRGRLNALVPGQATGFTVETPSSRVVDLGTEFDVSVAKDGETDVRVHQGEVELASLDDAAKKWNLRDGQFKSLQRDGSSCDFFLAADLGRTGQGQVSVNGIQFAVVDRKSFDAARECVAKELAQFRIDLAKRRGTASRGIVNLDGKQILFVNSTQFMSAWRETNAYLDKVQEMMSRMGTFIGSINLNGVEIRFDSTQDNLNQIDLLRRIGIDGATGGFGNLRELLETQEETMRRLGEGDAGTDGRSDLRGSIKVDGKDVNFGNLDELLKLRDSLRRDHGTVPEDHRSRLEDMRRRHEEIRNRHREPFRERRDAEPSHESDVDNPFRVVPDKGESTKPEPVR